MIDYKCLSGMMIRLKKWKIINHYGKKVSVSVTLDVIAVL